MNDEIVQRVRVSLAACALWVSACEAKPTAGADAQLVHLDDELASAQIQSASAPREAHAERAWSFAEPRPEWEPISSERFPGLAAVELEALPDGVRLALVEPTEPLEGLYVGGIAIQLDTSPSEAWTGVLVRARSRERLAGIAVACNVLADRDSVPGGFGFFTGAEGTAPVFSDGSVQTYHLPLRAQRCGASLQSLGVFAGATLPARLDILSVTLVPRGAAFLEDFGVRAVTREAVTRHTLFAHTPASLAWTISVPEGGRLDLGLTCLAGEKLTYTATVKVGAEAPAVLFDETLDGSADGSRHDAETWRQRSLDL